MSWAPLAIVLTQALNWEIFFNFFAFSEFLNFKKLILSATLTFVETLGNISLIVEMLNQYLVKNKNALSKIVSPHFGLPSISKVMIKTRKVH